MIESHNSNRPATVAVLMSGGIDSLACAHMLRGQGMQVRAIFVDYGQAALEPERDAVNSLTASLDIPLTTVSARGGNAFNTGELIGRNAFFVAAALFLGDVREGLIALGIHAGTPYYDCSPNFLKQIQNLTEEQTGGRVSVSAPFVSWNKRQIHQYVTSAGLLLEETYSCEAGTVPTCGACASCQDREALQC